MAPDPLEQVSAYVEGYGVAARPLREAIAALSAYPLTLDALVARFAVSRRAVEGLLDAAGDDVEHGPHGVAIHPDRVAAYRERFRAEEAERTRLPDPLDQRLAAMPELLRTTQRLAAAAPAPVRSLDHVAALPETVARRALWLDAHFDLGGSRLLCIGDHDLSGLAACAVNPDIAVTVVDVDERILAFIDDAAREHGWDVRCLYADARHGLPAPAQGWADAALTDPPYTPEGVQLFAARALQGLRNRHHGRLVVAYGFGEGHPALGLKVQRSLQRLHVTFEAIMPAFNRYQGAQAVGSASDLYVARPTARTWQQLSRLAGTAEANIYTRGGQAVGGAPAALDRETAAGLRAHAAGKAGLSVSVLVGDAWPEDPDVPRVGLARVLTRGLPAARGHPPAAVAGDLSGDPGPWLLRALLSVNANRLALRTANDHPDLASEQAQRRLGALLRAKYELHPRRSTPDGHHAVVVATRVAPERLEPGQRVVRWIFERAHGKVGNTWREGLIALSREGQASRAAADFDLRAPGDRRGDAAYAPATSDAGAALDAEAAPDASAAPHAVDAADATDAQHTLAGPLTKRAARAAVERAAGDGFDLDARLVELPRHRMTELVERVELSVRELARADRE